MEIADQLYDKAYTCRHCECKFTSKKVRKSLQKSTKRDTDFCTYYHNEANNPILYTVNVCPTCGFTFTEQFRPYLLPELKKAVQENITSRWTAKQLGQKRSINEAIITYKLAIYTADITKEAHSVKAGLYLRVAWLNRFKQNREEEERFLHMAVREYEESFVHSDYKQGDKEMSEVRILYLIGELYRRVGEYDRAVYYFGRTADLKNTTIEHGIIQMARGQWSLAREQNAAKLAAEKAQQEALDASLTQEP